MEKNYLKRKLLCDLRILLWGGLAILFAVLLVLELLPDHGAGISVKETVTVSSASLSPFDAEQKEYTCLVVGMLHNDSDDRVTVDRVYVTVSDGEQERRLELEGFTLPARTTHELSFVFEDTVEYDRVQAVSLITSAGEEVLPNHSENGLRLGMAETVYFALIILSGWWLSIAIKKRYYLWQESR